MKLSGLCAVIAFVFYDTVWGMLPALPVCVLLYKRDRRAGDERKKEQLLSEFKDVLVMLSSELSAGRSLESALDRLSGSYNGTGAAADRMKTELEIAARGLSLSKPPEQLIYEIGERNDAGEIKEFAGLIRINKRYGGDMAAMAGRTARQFTDRQALSAEVRSMVAAKRLEGLVMAVTPCAIVLYMRLTNPGYMDIMYDTAAGRVVMTVCLLMVMLAVYMMDRILRKL